MTENLKPCLILRRGVDFIAYDESGREIARRALRENLLRRLDAFGFSPVSLGSRIAATISDKTKGHYDSRRV